MHTKKHIKQSILILSFATLVVGCGGGSSTTSTGATASTSTATTAATTAATTTAATTTAATTTAAKAIQEGQVKDSATGKGVEGVKVSIGESTTTTDADGFYALSNLTADEEVVINFEKEGYLLGSTQIQIKSLSEDDTTSPNYLEYSMDTYDHQWSYDVQTEASGTNINIPANAYTDTVGESYDGNVTTKLEILDIATDEGKTLFPGTFEGKNINGETVQFSSYGLISIEPKDTSGNTLNFTDNSIITLTFNSVASLDEQSVPMWYYNYDQGMWIEEGYAERQEDGTYRGEISHPGTWSLSKPLEDAPGIYRGRIVLTDGTPAQDIRIYAVGNNWSSSDLSTDEDGIFEIEVVPGDSFQLVAYNYKDKYGAKYNGTISAIASGEIVEDRM